MEWTIKRLFKKIKEKSFPTLFYENSYIKKYIMFDLNIIVCTPLVLSIIKNNIKMSIRK